MGNSIIKCRKIAVDSPVLRMIMGAPWCIRINNMGSQHSYYSGRDKKANTSYLIIQTILQEI